jgi:hypothetical protein
VEQLQYQCRKLVQTWRCNMCDFTCPVLLIARIGILVALLLATRSVDVSAYRNDVQFGQAENWGFSVTGEGGSLAGNAVSRAGNINGDQYEDFLVTAQNFSLPSRASCGAVIVIFGYGPQLANRSANDFRLSVQMSPDIGYMIYGEFAGQRIGSSVCGGGDINGDGLDDIAFGASTMLSSNQTSISGVYVVFGKQLQHSAHVDLANWTAVEGFRIAGARPFDLFGYALVFSANLNNGKIDDLVISAPAGSTASTLNTGVVYVLFGSNVSFSDIDAATFAWGSNTTGVKITGPTTNSSLGIALAAGDIDGDGHADLAISAPYASPFRMDSAGIVYVIYGGALSENIDLATWLGDSFPSPGFKIHGSAAQSLAGKALSVVGDLDGDGMNELAIGAPGYMQTGAVFIVRGAPRGQDVNLTAFDGPTTDGVKWVGEAGSLFGMSVSAAADFDGDGLADVIVGAPEAASPGRATAATGVSYVIFGGSLAHLDMAQFQTSDATGVKISGTYGGQRVGDAVAGIGDVNGDGVDDVCVGAPSDSGNDGTAFVVFGSGDSPTSQPTGQPTTQPFGAPSRQPTLQPSRQPTSQPSRQPTRQPTGRPSSQPSSQPIRQPTAQPTGAPTAEFRDVVFGSGERGALINGPTAGGYAGQAVSLIADTNGDGVADILVAAPAATFSGRTSCGVVYVLFGSHSAPPPTNLTAFVTGTNGYKIIGATAGARLGEAACGAGDVNKDGVGDILVGSTGVNGAGAAYLVFGSATRSDLTDIDLSAGLATTKGFSITGGTSGDLLGYSVAAAGDVNDDAYDDILVGAPMADPLSRVDAGAAYLIFGRGNAADVDVTSMSASVGTKYYGASAGAQCGWAVAGLGDINGDSWDDFAIGAPGESALGAMQAGKVYVVYGSSSALLASGEVNLASGAQAGYAFTIIGSTTSGNLGYAVSGVGDFNGDGKMDYAIGAPGELSKAGVVYIIYGTGTSQSADISVANVVSGCSKLVGGGSFSLGASLHNAGDFNLDGRSDLIVGAFGAGGFKGKAFVVFGHTLPALTNMTLFVSGQATGLQISGAGTGDRSGYSVGGGYDVNGDGGADIIIGAFGVNTFRGAAYVYYGEAPVPSAIPTIAPTRSPSAIPSPSPTSQPSCQPSRQPSRQPTSRPTLRPTSQPSAQPTQPTAQPSVQPTRRPTVQPSSQPSQQPASRPTSQPSRQPVSGPSGQPTSQPTRQPSRQPSVLPTSQPTRQPSSLPSRQPSCRPSLQPSGQPSARPSQQPSSQPSRRPSGQPLGAPTSRPSGQPSSQPSVSPTGRPSCQPVSRPTSQPSGQPSKQPTTTPTVQPTEQPVAQPSARPSAQPSLSPSSQSTAEPTLQPSAQPTGRPSTEPTSQPSVAPTSVPSSEPSFQPSSRPSSEPSSLPSSAPTSQPTSAPTASPTAAPSWQPTSTPTGDPTSQPSTAPSAAPSVQPTAKPSAVPTAAPTAQPTSSPTSEPTAQPTSHPSARPAAEPTSEPSARPTNRPTARPTALPSAVPTARPTLVPTVRPTSAPSVQPTGRPSSQPTTQPSVGPSPHPTPSPTPVPTLAPTQAPTCRPTAKPTSRPSQTPSAAPTEAPTPAPTASPTAAPTAVPTASPTRAPTCAPTRRPSAAPTVMPTEAPSQLPTVAAGKTAAPSRAPTTAPTLSEEQLWLAHQQALFMAAVRNQTVRSVVHRSAYRELQVRTSSLPTVVGSCNAWRSMLEGELDASALVYQPVQLQVIAMETLGTTVALRCDDTATVQSLVQALLNKTATYPLTLSCGGNAWTVAQCSSLRVPSVCVNCSDPCATNVHCSSGTASTSPFTVSPCVQSSCPAGSSVVTAARYLDASFDERQPAPLVLSRSVLSTKTSLEVTATLSAPGSMYCAVYVLDPNAESPLAPSSTSAVLLQNFVDSTDASNVTAVTISGLPSATDFLVYCMTVSRSGSMQSLEDVLAQPLAPSTTCCIPVLVQPVTTSVTEGTALRNFLQISVNTRPTADITITLDVTSTSGSSLTTVPLFPASFRIGALADSSATFGVSGSRAGASSLQSQLLRATSSLTALPVGAYAYTVTLSGPSASQFNVLYASPSRSFAVMANNTPLPAPQLVSVASADDGSHVLINFDSNTDKGRGAMQFACSALFSFACADKSSCVWSSSKQVQAFVSAQSGCAAVNSPVSMAAGATVRAQCQLSACDNSLWPTASTTASVNVTSSQSTVAPTVAISAPSALGSCDTLSLDLSASSGNGGRSWLSRSITVETLATSNVTDLQWFLSNTYKDSPPTPIPAALLSKGYAYNFVVKLCNFMGKCSQGSKRVLVQDKAVPTVTLPGASLRTVARSAQLLVSSDAYVQGCLSGSRSRSDLAYSWTVSLAGVPQAVPSLSKDPSRLRLPAYSLQVGSLYDISLKVTIAATLQSSTSAMQVYVAQGSVVAVVQQGLSRTVQVQQRLTIGGSGSYDEDQQSVTGLSAGLRYSWSCAQLEPYFSANCTGMFTSSNVAASDSTFTAVARADAAGYVGQVTMYVLDAAMARSAEAVIAVTVAPSLSPVVELDSNVPGSGVINSDQELQLMGRVTLPAGYNASAVWAVDDQSNFNFATSVRAPTSVYVPASPGAGATHVYLVIGANTLPD